MQTLRTGHAVAKLKLRLIEVRLKTRSRAGSLRDAGGLADSRAGVGSRAQMRSADEPLYAHGRVHIATVTHSGVRSTETTSLLATVSLVTPPTRGAGGATPALT